MGSRASLTEILDRVAGLSRPAVMAIDGRCGSGKTGLAAFLRARLPCRVVHMDDFYLPPSRRAPGWEGEAAGNMDLTRVLAEVLEPARWGEAIVYRPYDCHAGGWGTMVELPPEGLTVVEGSYSNHPSLGGCYGLTVFVTCAARVQEERLHDREGEAFPAFLNRWIPLEERYFQQCGILERCDLVLDTSEGIFPKHA